MTRGADRLQRAWYARGVTPAARLLAPLAWIFGAAAALRRAAYRAGILRRAKLPVPVVVVGNITVGGSGKTPLVRTLVDALRARGRRPGIVSRGYGRRTRDTRAVRPGDDARDAGDEPLLLAASGAPVWIGADRAAAARSLLAAHPDVDVIVADDGLQHYALARDVEIAVVDATRGLGNGLLLPAGPLREPASRLATVDAVVRLVREGAAPAPERPASEPSIHSGESSNPPREYAMTQEPLEWVNVSDPVRTFDPALLRDPTAIALAGVADPAKFFEGLRARGFHGIAHAFADHHAYTADEVAFAGAAAILMTEKDAVKCRAFADSRMWMLPIRARVDAALIDFVLERIDGSEAPRDARLSGHERTAPFRP